MRRTLACLMVALSAASMPAVAQDSTAPQAAPDVSSRIEWAAGRVIVDVTRPLDPSTPSLVRAKADAEIQLDQGLPDALFRALGPLPVDSSHVLSDYYDSNPAFYGRLNDIAAHAQRTDLFLTGDFSALVARYSLPFFGDSGIGSPLYPLKATPIRRRLGDVATRAYTGVLIFARGLLPSAGTSRLAAVRPALFPRIWDEQMDLVLDKDMCAPESLRAWGMVGYSQAVDDPAADLRVGTVPLRIAARGVFGDNDTDVVISMDAALQLLTLPENIALLQQGRIVIVYDALQGPGISGPRASEGPSRTRLQ